MTMLSRFHRIPERDGQRDRRTDGRQTDRFAIPNYQYRASVCWRAIQEAQMSQRDRAMLCVIEYFAKTPKVIRNDNVECRACI